MIDKSYLENLTPEQREEMRRKASETREAKKIAGENLKKDYLDMPHWRELASKAACGIRFPSDYIPCSDVKYARRVLKKLGRDVDWWKEKTGYKNLAEFGKMNPEWNAQAMVGLILEDYFEELGGE